MAKLKTPEVSTAKKTRRGRKPKVSKEVKLKAIVRDLHKEGLGAVASIVKLYKKGFSKKEIIEAGFNKSTVYRQAREKVDLA